MHNYVSQLRKLLGGDIVRRNGTGYVIDVSPAQLDVDRFAALLESARTARSADTTAATVRDALALWHGDPLADVAGAAFAQPEIVRLRELRAAARELLFEAELAQHRYRETVPALEAALLGDPLRERLWWLLMTALHRSGRQADALRAYHRARQLLIEQLGIDPAPSCRNSSGPSCSTEPTAPTSSSPLAAPGRRRITRESPARRTQARAGRDPHLPGRTRGPAPAPRRTRHR